MTCNTVYLPILGGAGGGMRGAVAYPRRAGRGRSDPAGHRSMGGIGIGHIDRLPLGQNARDDRAISRSLQPSLANARPAIGQPIEHRMVGRQFAKLGGIFLDQWIFTLAHAVLRLDQDQLLQQLLPKIRSNDPQKVVNPWPIAVLELLFK